MKLTKNCFYNPFMVELCCSTKKMEKWLIKEKVKAAKMESIHTYNLGC